MMLTPASDDALFTETQRLWGCRPVLVLLGVVVLIATGVLAAFGVQTPAAAWGLVLGFVVLVLIQAGVLSWGIRTRVDPDGVHVRGMPVPFPSWQIKPSDIAWVERITVSALREWGGWGPRWKPTVGMAALFSGPDAVRLMLASGQVRVISTRQPDELAASIEALLPADPREGP